MIDRRGGRGRARRSTSGGLAVPRTATAIRAAALPTLPLVRPLRLAALADPLASLTAEPPGVDALGEAASRAEGDGTGTRAGRRRQAAPGGAGQRPGAPPAEARTGWPGRTSSIPDGGRSRSGSAPAAAAPSLTASPAASPAPLPWAPSERRGSATRSGAGGAPAGRMSAAELAEAARRDLLGADLPGRPAAEPRTRAAGSSGPDDHAATPAVDSDGSPESGAPARPSMPPVGTPPPPDSAAATWPPRAGPAPVASEPPGPVAPATDAGALSAAGALGELVDRWQQAVVPEHPGTTGAPSPFVPLTPTSADPATEAAGHADAGDDRDALEWVGLALDELLRREVEQHGLEGGSS